MKCVLLLIVLLTRFQCRRLDVEQDENSFENQIAYQNIETCIQDECVYKDEDMMNVCKGFNSCVIATCKNELQEYNDFMKCNQNCLDPFIINIPESDRELINVFYICRLQCVRKEIKQNLKPGNNDINDNDDQTTERMRIQAIFISISIFVALLIGIALYIWCSIYHRRRQDLIIVPGQIISNAANQQSQQGNQEILQSRITDPDRIFVIEGSTILHQNQNIIPKFGFHQPSNLIIGTSMVGVAEKQTDNTTIINATSTTYNNISMVEFNNDQQNNWIQNANSNNVNSNSNQQNRSNFMINQSMDVDRNNQSVIEMSNLSNNQSMQLNQTTLAQNNATEDRSPFYGDRSNKIIPIHDIYIPQLNLNSNIDQQKKVQKQKEKGKITNSLSSPQQQKKEDKEDNLNLEQKNKNEKSDINNKKWENLQRLNLFIKENSNDVDQKSKVLIGSDKIKKTSKPGSKRPSKRNSILASLENRSSTKVQNRNGNGQVAPFFVFFTDKSDQQSNNKESEGVEDQSEYEYYYETGSSNDSSDVDNELGSKQTNTKQVVRKSIYKEEEIGKSQISLEIPRDQRKNESHQHQSKNREQEDDNHKKDEEEEKPAQKLAAEGVNISNGSNNKYNGSTDDTIIQICSTSQNFGQSGFTLRNYSSEKAKENDSHLSNRFNESQKIMVNQNNLGENQVPYFNQSQVLSPEIFYQEKQSPQNLLLKICDEMNVMHNEVRKKSSSIDISTNIVDNTEFVEKQN